LNELPFGSDAIRMDVAIDWQPLAKDVQVERRLGYIIYTLPYHHPEYSENQRYTSQMTSYELASLFGYYRILVLILVLLPFQWILLSSHHS
jgi:hypothetical protein